MNKLLSARFWIATTITATGCTLAILEKLGTEFTSIWMAVLAFYFGRNDRLRNGGADSGESQDKTTTKWGSNR